MLPDSQMSSRTPNHIPPTQQRPTGENKSSSQIWKQSRETTTEKVLNDQSANQESTRYSILAGRMKRRREAMCATMKQGATQPPTAAKRASSQPAKKHGDPRLRVSHSGDVRKSHSGDVPCRCREQPKEHAPPERGKAPRAKEGAPERRTSPHAAGPRARKRPARKRRRPRNAERARAQHAPERGRGPARTCP